MLSGHTSEAIDSFTEEDELALEFLSLPPLTLTRNSGFNEFLLGTDNMGTHMEFIGAGLGFNSEILQRSTEIEFENTFPSDESQIAQNKYECNICYVSYDLGRNRPLSLTCGHTICASCVKNMY